MKGGGGLGVINLELQNKALLMKNMHKFFNKVNLPWVQLVWEQYYANFLPSNTQANASFWWKDNLKLLENYKEITTCNCHCGNTIQFWKDSWQGEPLSSKWPQLYSFVHQQDISVADIIREDDITDHFHLPLSVEAFDQLQELNALTSNTVLVLDNLLDTWTYPWAKREYQVAHMYKILISHIDIQSTFTWNWASCFQLKHKIFI